MGQAKVCGRIDAWIFIPNCRINTRFFDAYYCTSH